MKRFSVIGLLIVLLTVVGLVPSCHSETALRDRIVVTALGLSGNESCYTVAVQSVESLKTASGLSEQNEAATAVYTASGASLSTALDAFLGEAGRKTYVLQNRLVVVGEDLCRAASLFDTMEYLLHHTDGRARVPVAVCRGEPSALLNTVTDNEAIPANYPVGILKEGAASGLCVISTVSDVRRASSGMTDVALPIFTMIDKRPHVDGTLLFRNGVAVGELTAAQTQGLSLLLGQTQELLAVVDGVTYAVTSPRVTVQISRDGTRHAYTFHLTAQARAIENRNDAVADEKEITAHLTHVLEQTLAALDAVDSDPLGLARQTARRDRTTTQKTARSQLKTCDKAVLVTVKMQNQGNGIQRLSSNE